MRLVPGLILWPKPQSRTGCPFSLFCLAPQGVCPATAVTRSAVSSYLAISPLPLDKLGAVYFLRHFPSPCHYNKAPRLSPGMLPCGVRTFLWDPKAPAIISGLFREKHKRDSCPCERRLPQRMIHPPSNSAPLFHAMVIPTTKKARTESSNKTSQAFPGLSAGSIVR